MRLRSATISSNSSLLSFPTWAMPNAPMSSSVDPAMAIQDRPQLLQARPPKVSTNECPAIVVIALLLRCRTAFLIPDLQKARRVAEVESENSRSAGCCRPETSWPTFTGGLWHFWGSGSAGSESGRRRHGSAVTLPRRPVVGSRLNQRGNHPKRRDFRPTAARSHDPLREPRQAAGPPSIVPLRRPFFTPRTSLACCAAGVDLCRHQANANLQAPRGASGGRHVDCKAIRSVLDCDLRIVNHGRILVELHRMCGNDIPGWAGRRHGLHS
jgi:hypothetical protein